MHWAAVGAALSGGVAVVAMLVDDDPTPLPAGAAQAFTLLDGASLFQAKGCATCHTGPDSTSQMVGFPDLRDASTWAAGRVPGQSAEQYLAESMRSPGVFIAPAFESPSGPTTGMPTLAISEAEIDVLVAYLLDE